MAATPEAKVKAKVTRILKHHEVYYFTPVTGGYGVSGVPDVICCVRGRFLAIECKAGRGKTTLLQDLNIANIRRNGGIALVVNEQNIADVEAVLDTLGKVDEAVNGGFRNVL